MVTVPRWQPEVAADKDSLSGSFCLCACGWLNSSQREWSSFLSQRKFCYFSPYCSSTSFLSFSLSTSSFWNLWVLYFFLAFFFPYFLILENRDLDSPLFVLLFLHVIARLSEYKISLFIFCLPFLSHAHISLGTYCFFPGFHVHRISLMFRSRIESM